MLTRNIMFILIFQISQTKEEYHTLKEICSITYRMNESLEIDKKLFLKKFKKIISDFSQKLQEYIKNPNDENIHDIRVTIRRLESAYKILPKNARKSRKMKDYMKQSRLLFKLNTKIRDFDIICEKMELRYKDITLDLVSTLKNFRIEELQNGRKLAVKISDISIPKISSNIKKSKLNKRYLKVIDRIDSNIQKNTIIALEDDRRVEELHLLRKNFKKLRYSLELIPNKERTAKIIKNLKGVQDILGDIHDSDIIIDYFKNNEQSSKYSDIIEFEILERRNKYNVFVSAFKKNNDK
jgi:CHAD domain-containing protein